MAVLGGCAVSDYRRPTIERVGAGDGNIVFAADVFRGAAPERVRFTDIWQREEYALFRGGAARATDARTQADAALIAHGPSPSADRGNASFPFDLAESFAEGGEGDKKN